MRAAHRHRQLLRFLPLIVLGLLGLRTHFYYVERSGGSIGKSKYGLVEVPYASESGLLDELGGLRRANKGQQVIADTGSIVSAKLLALYLNPAAVRFPAADYFEHLVALNPTTSTFRLSERLIPGLPQRALEIVERLKRLASVGIFDMKSAGNPPRENVFFRWRDAPADSTYNVVESSPTQSPINRRQFGPRLFPNLRLEPAGSVSNHLISIASDLGANLYIGGRFGRGNGRIALYQSEPDYFYDGQTMASIGRYLLFGVLRPAPTVRAVVDFTASLNADGENRIPAAVAIGDQKVPFHICGRGSARLFSPPLHPQIINSQAYFMLDMGVEPFRFSNERLGLMALYGKQIRLDPRSLVGFVRDISVVSDEEYNAMRAPAAIASFPKDIANPNLEYCGAYEDGWVSENSRLVLQAPAAPSRLCLRASVPRVDAAQPPQTFSVLVDGVEINRRTLATGELEIDGPVLAQFGKREIEIRSTSGLRLPPPDNRPVSFQLHSLAFVEQSPEDRQEIAGDPVRVGSGWYPFEKFGGQTFRWVAHRAELDIEAAAPTAGTIMFEVESGPGFDMSAFDLEVHVRAAVTVLHVPAGHQTLRVPLRLIAGRNPITLQVEGGGRPAKNDPRTLNFRVFRVAWQTNARDK